MTLKKDKVADFSIYVDLDQINLEYRLSISKAAESMRHAIHCGLMLAKARAERGLTQNELMQWVRQEITAGTLEINEDQADQYVRLACSSINDPFYLTQPSIRAALELLLANKGPE